MRFLINPVKKTMLSSRFIALGAAIAFPQAALSQEFSLEEVVVTARKQAESLQSVPVTVSAFTESGLENRGIENTADIGDFISNVQFDTSSTFAGTSTFQAFIRGIGQGDFAINTDPGVGVYVDGVYYARAAGSVLELLDVERVEVLKGPQGTLFGRNSIGGAVNVITRKPSDEAEFKIQATVGEFDRTDLSFVANVPLAETVFTSLAISTSNRDGFQERIPFPGAAPLSTLNQTLVTGPPSSEEDLGEIATDTFRGKLVWDATENFSLTFSGDFTESNNSASAITLLNAEEGIADSPPGASLTPLFNLCVAGFAPVQPICDTSAFIGEEILPFDNRFLTGDIDTTFATGANFSDSEDFGFSITADWQITENINLKSITSYREIDQAFGVDIDSSPTSFDQTTFTIDQDQFSQEYQLTADIGQVNFTVGAFYFEESASQADNVPIAGGLLQISGDNSQDVESISLFGELNWAVSDTVNLVAGVRFTDEEKTLQLNQQNLNSDFFVVTGFPLPAFPREDLTFLGPEEPQEADFENTSVRLGANWQVNDNIFLYGTFSQGFKSGGFTTRLTAPFNADFAAIIGGPTDLSFDEETVDSFEFGFKGQFLNNRLRFNAAAFFNTYDDIQIVSQVGISPVNQNAGEADINGLELELEALITENINLIATYGFIDAEYTELDEGVSTGPFGIITLDDELPNTPENTASIALNVRFPNLVPGEAAFNVNYSFTDEVFNDAENTPLLLQESSEIVNASISWLSPNDRWDFRLGVNNLTDERRLISGFNGGALSLVVGSFNRPREAYFSVGIDF